MIQELQSGNVVISNDSGSVRFLVIFNGPAFNIQILENEFIKDSDEWVNREIEIHELIRKVS